MIKIAIIDDDKIFLTEYKKLTENFMKGTGKKFVIDTYDSAQEVIAGKMDYDLYCLDVEMTAINGFQMAQKIREMRGNDPYILFVSVSESAVFDVFRYNVLGFVRKTNVKDDTEEAMNRFINGWNDKRKTLEFVTREGVFFRKPIKNLIYAEARGHMLELHCSDGVYKVRGTLSELVQKLQDYDFVQPYKGYLVNCIYVCRLGQRELHLRTDDKKVIPVSKYKAAEIKSAFVKYLDS